MHTEKTKISSQKILRAWLPVLLWMLLIFFFSSNSDPYQLLPPAWRQFAASPVLEGSSISDFLNPLMHFASFAILAFLLSRALFNHNLPLHKVMLLSLLLTMLYALSDEIHQLFVLGRTFQIFDLFIDLLGAISGYYFHARHITHQKQTAQ